MTHLSITYKNRNNDEERYTIQDETLWLLAIQRFTADEIQDVLDVGKKADYSETHLLHMMLKCFPFFWFLGIKENVTVTSSDFVAMYKEMIQSWKDYQVTNIQYVNNEAADDLECMNVIFNERISMRSWTLQVWKYGMQNGQILPFKINLDNLNPEKLEEWALNTSWDEQVKIFKCISSLDITLEAYIERNHSFNSELALLMD